MPYLWHCFIDFLLLLCFFLVIGNIHNISCSYPYLWLLITIKQ